MVDMSQELRDKDYEKKALFVQVRGIVQNPRNMRQTPFNFRCRVDTGFDGGVTAPHWFRSDVDTIGIQPLVRNWTLANGEKVPVYTCAAYLHQIDRCVFPMPGLAVKMVMLGNVEKHLLGMDSLQYCTLIVDGSNEKFSMIFT